MSFDALAGCPRWTQSPQKNRGAPAPSLWKLQPRSWASSSRVGRPQLVQEIRGSVWLTSVEHACFNLVVRRAPQLQQEIDLEPPLGGVGGAEL